MQAYENIALQYYYLGMMDKSSQYHKLMTRGSDPADRPKGFETRKKNQPTKIGLRDIER